MQLREANHFVPSSSPRTTGSMWMGSASTACATFSPRGIQLPEGSPDDPPQAETVGGLGNRKNDLVNTVIEEVGVEPYAGSVEFIHQLRHQGFKIAVVTSSQNCEAVLKAAKLDAFFEVRVDGNMIHAQHLAGSPPRIHSSRRRSSSGLSRHERSSSRMPSLESRPGATGTSGW